MQRRVKHHYHGLTGNIAAYIYIGKVEKYFLADILGSVFYPGGEVTKLRKGLRKPASFMWKIVSHFQFSVSWEQIRQGAPRAAENGDRKTEVFQQKVENALIGKVRRA